MLQSMMIWWALAIGQPSLFLAGTTPYVSSSIPTWSSWASRDGIACRDKVRRYKYQSGLEYRSYMYIGCKLWKNGRVQKRIEIFELSTWDYHQGLFCWSFKTETIHMHKVLVILSSIKYESMTLKFYVLQSSIKDLLCIRTESWESEDRNSQPKRKRELQMNSTDTADKQ